MTTRNNCQVSNGTYACNRDEGHEGLHESPFYSKVRDTNMIALFKDAHSEMTYSKPAPHHYVKGIYEGRHGTFWYRTGDNMWRHCESGMLYSAIMANNLAGPFHLIKRDPFA